jgi:alkylation response protein AidB-like acyl-CoA dehydrogenase
MPLSVSPSPSVAGLPTPSLFLVPPADDGVTEQLRTLAAGSLAPIAQDIDKGFYPEAFLREVGAAGGFAQHCGPGHALGATIEGMAALSEVCLSTGFMDWCQNTLVWYVLNSDNAALKARFLDAVSSGRKLGGTGLSNPMKTIFGIEQMKLKGEKVEGGYRIRGILPWVSNLGPEHLFGAMFETGDGNRIMCLIDCADPAVTLKPCEPFLAMDGTGTFAVQVRDLFLPQDMILADPAMPYIRKIRAGFVLLQAGMAIGLVRDCIRMMEEVRPSLGHVNCYLDVQPEDIAAALSAIETEVFALAKTPYDTSDAYWKRVVAARLQGGEASVQAAHHAMLHCGARGYVSAHRCQRRLREAYFVAIVTPATKQLRKMLSEMP